MQLGDQPNFPGILADIYPLSGSGINFYSSPQFLSMAR